VRPGLVPVRAVGAACLLAGPTALAFFAGGFYTEPRLIAALVAWSCVLLLALTAPAPLPRAGAGWAVLGGLVLITVWSAVSLAWAPLRGPAIQNVERLALYVGALMLALGVLRARPAMRAVEPALAGGIVVVIGYGLAGRLLPGLLHLAHSRSAGGRLEQPITYWNAEGALAAVGLVLCARLAGDGTRPAWLRVAAGARAAPLGAGVYLSYSRGAIAVALVGLVVLVDAIPSRTQLRAVAVAVAAGGAAAAASAAFRGVASLAGTLGDRERDGAIALVILGALAAGAGLATARGRTDPEGSLRWPRRRGRVSAVVLACVAIGLIVGGLSERSGDGRVRAGANASRLTTAASNRYEYWRVALRAFERRPVTGVGSGGFRVEWLRERRIRETVRDTHSLELEMAAELGVVGLLGLAIMVGGVAVAAGRALRHRPEPAAGACAATLAWFLHASIDWDWQLPAVSLPAIVLAGALIIMGEAEDVR
jgi:hypothetical protein